MKRFYLNTGLNSILAEISRRQQKPISEKEKEFVKSIISSLDDNMPNERVPGFVISVFLREKQKALQPNCYQENQIRTISNSESQLKFITNPNLDGKFEEKKKMTLQSLLGPTNLNETMSGKNSLMTFDSLVLARKKLLFDSRNKTDETSWDLVSYKTNFSEKGQVVVGGYVQQLIEVELLPFLLPIPHNTPDIIYYDKIFVAIEEFRSQATINSINEDKHKNIQYIFSCSTQQFGNFLRLKPDSIWRPQDIITEITKISVKFFTAYGEIILDADRFRVQVSATNPAVITTPVPHYLSTGDIIYLANNQDKSYYVSVLSATTFSIPLNSTSPFETEIFLSGKSLRFEMIFSCLEK